MGLQLRISEEHHAVLQKHLYPGDGQESVAVAICGRFKSGKEEYVLINDLLLIEDQSCRVREEGRLNWPTEKVIPFFHRIMNEDLAILKIHSHPGGYRHFSDLDEASDLEFFSSVFGWSTNDSPHVSAIMLPDGEIFGRFFYQDLSFSRIDKVIVAGGSIMIFEEENSHLNPDYAIRTIQAFGEKTFQTLRKMKVGVVGCSGTGSPTIEQLTRLGIGHLVLVDPDHVEDKNLNRILNSKKIHAEKSISKVVMVKNEIDKMGFDTKVDIFESNLYDDVKALKELISCDIIFGCIDSVDGRHLLNQLSTFYIIPYIDMGVKLEADGKGGIAKICGTVHSIQPGKSSLISRGLYNIEDLVAASQYRKNIDEYKNLRKNSYIKNVNISSPAVISVNMQISAHAVNEFLNRIHLYKAGLPENYAQSTIDLTENYIVNIDEGNLETDLYLKNRIGRGDVIPFLEMPEIKNEMDQKIF